MQTDKNKAFRFNINYHLGWVSSPHDGTQRASTVSTAEKWWEIFLAFLTYSH